MQYECYAVLLYKCACGLLFTAHAVVVVVAVCHYLLLLHSKISICIDIFYGSMYISISCTHAASIEAIRSRICWHFLRQGYLSHSISFSFDQWTVWNTSWAFGELSFSIFVDCNSQNWRGVIKASWKCSKLRNELMFKIAMVLLLECCSSKSWTETVSNTRAHTTNTNRETETDNARRRKRTQSFVVCNMLLFFFCLRFMCYMQTQAESDIIASVVIKIEREKPSNAICKYRSFFGIFCHKIPKQKRKLKQKSESDPWLECHWPKEWNIFEMHFHAEWTEWHLHLPIFQTCKIQ